MSPKEEYLIEASFRALPVPQFGISVSMIPGHALTEASTGVLPEWVSRPTGFVPSATNLRAMVFPPESSTKRNGALVPYSSQLFTLVPPGLGGHTTSPPPPVEPPPVAPENDAETECVEPGFALETTQVAPLPEQSPLQETDGFEAVSVTGVPTGNSAEQAPGQSIPGAVTVPVPETETETV